jgi:transposase-like protein
MRKRYTAAQREQLIAEVRSTGETVRVVAERHGVSASMAYLWMKRAGGSSSSSQAPVFARVVPAAVVKKKIAMVVEVGRATIRVEEGFSATLLREVVMALSEPA